MRVTIWLATVSALGTVYLLADVSIHRSLIVLGLWSIALVVTQQPVGPSGAVAVLVTLGVAALLTEPLGSDLWFYQAYGRIVEEYHANPFVSPPGDFIGDPVVDRTVDFYREIGSVYGPVFIVLATVVSALSGTGELAGRLAWQGVSLVAVGGILVVLRRRGTPWHQVVLIGASPAVVYLLIHQAHNDVFVGLLILIGAVSAQSGHHVPASLSFAAAALVKAPSGIALVTFVVWLLARRERRAAGWCLASTAVLGAVVVSPFGLDAVLGPLTERSGETNATSLWNVVRGDALSFVWRPERTIDPSASAVVSVAGIIVPVSIAVIAAWRLRSRPVHEPLTVAVLAWVVFSLYPSVWLTGWFVALAGLWSGRVGRLLIGYSSLSLLTSQSWLMPVAAIVDRGTYGWVERLAAMLLGVTSVVGVALIVHLGGGKADRATWNEEGVAGLAGAPWGKEVRNDRKGTSQ